MVGSNAVTFALHRSCECGRPARAPYNSARRGKHYKLSLRDPCRGSALLWLGHGGLGFFERIVSAQSARRSVAACTSAAGASGRHSSRGLYVIHTVRASLNSSGFAVAGRGKRRTFWRSKREAQEGSEADMI